MGMASHGEISSEYPVGIHHDILQEYKPGLWQRRDFTGGEGRGVEGGKEVLCKMTLHSVLA